MQNYIGTKQIEAEPMTRAAYNEMRGWKLPADEDGSDEGYLVKYSDNYISWSPKKQFEDAYQTFDSLSFGHAVELAKAGNLRMKRAGWNGKNQFVVVMTAMSLPSYNTQGTDRKVNDRTARWIGEDTPLESQPYFAIFNEQKKWQPGWIPSQSDIFANDWMVVE